MVGLTSVTHVIFDMDGTLVDSEAVNNKIIHHICDRFGKEFTWDMKQNLMGRNEADAFKLLIEGLELPVHWQEYYAEILELAQMFMHDLELMPGAEKLVRHLREHGIPMAVATGSSCQTLKVKTYRFPGFFSLFDHIVLCSEDPEVKNSKPAPDCYLLAAERFPRKVAPQNCLVIEDAPIGAESGLAAGMQVVWVPDSHIDKTINGLDKRVTQLLTSLEEFKPDDFGLPAYGSKIRQRAKTCIIL